MEAGGVWRLAMFIEEGSVHYRTCPTQTMNVMCDSFLSPGVDAAA